MKRFKIFGAMLAIATLLASPIIWAANENSHSNDSGVAVVSAPKGGGSDGVKTGLSHEFTLIGSHFLVIRDAKNNVVKVINEPNSWLGKNYSLGAGLAGTTSATPHTFSACWARTTGQYMTVFSATTLATTTSTGASSTTQTLSGTCPSSASVASFGLRASSGR